MSKNTIIVLIFVLWTLTMAGCVQQEGDNITAQTEKCEYSDVSAAEAFNLIENEDIFILDVRTQSEYDNGHLENSYLIPVSELEYRLDEVPSDTAILVYCRSGRRSVTASNILLDAGYCDVYNMEAGFNEWRSEGYPYVE
ncbi:rhodanese-like domain-containing protein [Methanohalophilus portucalensis]|uniref:Rhodanese-like domain-containing protein n=3 Tax=Methanohalophilus portucalensis TaxID=39664 RepID=A0A3M9LJU4_9EURY|nr:rhodanese-like domain-containing protein [Methanohalophilus portucalensis]RNI13550.1 rhodanese-like domain-containing protein [Methanohalophilus portucalensis FDF-1]